MTELKKNLRWAAAFLALIALCIAVIIFRGFTQKAPKTAEILQNGEIIRTLDLESVGEPYEFEVVSSDGGYNTVRVEQGKIAVTDADCPDKICVRQGFIESGTLPIVCLPHRLSIVIKDDGSDIDALSGGMP